MKTQYIVALSVAAGIAIGAAAIQTLHAQAKPPGYVVVEIDVSNPDAYAKEFLPGAGKALTDGGIKFLARGGKSMAIEGAPPKSRLVIAQFESLEKAQRRLHLARLYGSQKNRRQICDIPHLGH